MKKESNKLKNILVWFSCVSVFLLMVSFGVNSSVKGTMALDAGCTCPDGSTPVDGNKCKKLSNEEISGWVCSEKNGGSYECYTEPTCYKCWQCNSPSTVYHYGATSTGGSPFCRSGWHEYTLSAGQSCPSSIFYVVQFHIDGVKKHTFNCVSVRGSGSSWTCGTPTTDGGYGLTNWHTDSKCESDPVTVPTYVTSGANYYRCSGSSGTEYTISYNPNGGTGSTQSFPVAKGATHTIKSNLFTRQCYSFTGWNTKSDGSGTSYSPGSNYVAANAGLTLYAQWGNYSCGSGGVTKYTISYDANGGSGSMPSETASKGSNYTIKSNAFTRQCYTFTGWLGSDGKNYSDKGTISNVGSDIVLKAQWGNYSCDTPDPSDEEVSSRPTNENVDTNPPTGDIAIFVVWILAVAGIVYSVWSFKQVKEN